jgi:hypothetical protein
MNLNQTQATEDLKLCYLQRNCIQIVINKCRPKTADRLEKEVLPGYIQRFYNATSNYKKVMGIK